MRDAQLHNDYRAALKEVRKVGEKYATGDAELASTCRVLASMHAVNPVFIFGAARRKGISRA